MRTVTVHLKNATKTDALDWLNSFARSQGRLELPRLYPKQGDPVLYINRWDTFELDEPEDKERVIAQFGGDRGVKPLHLAQL